MTITASTDCPAPVSDPLATAVARELGVDSSADTFCERRAVLAPPEPTRPGSQAPPLALMIRPGTVVPGSADVSGGSPMRVVVVGHAAPLAASTSATGGPVGPALVVDRVVWANGLWRAPITSVDPLLLLDGPRLAWRIRDRLAADAVGPGETLLRETLLPPDALTSVDPAAADRSLFDGALPSRTWYRVSIVDGDAGRRVAWVAIDDVRGRLVGHGDMP